MDNATLLKENGRLRKEMAGYQSELEAMEVRAKTAEHETKELRKKLNKIGSLLNEGAA